MSRADPAIAILYYYPIEPDLSRHPDCGLCIWLQLIAAFSDGSVQAGGCLSRQHSVLEAGRESWKACGRSHDSIVWPKSSQ